MLEKLFSSKTRVKILAHFFDQPDNKYYLKKISDNLKTDPGNTFKEIDNLQKIGLLSVEKKGEQKYYYLNKKFKYLNGLREVFDIYNEETRGEQWFMLEEIPPKVNPNGLISYMVVLKVNGFLKSLGFKNFLHQSMMEFENKTCRLYFLIKDFDRLGREIVEKLTADSKWGLDYIKNTIKHYEDYFKASAKVYQSNLRDFSDKQLLDLYFNQYEAELKMRYDGWIQNTVEMGDQLFSKFIIKYLENIIKEQKAEIKVGEAFSLLTTPTRESYAQKEYQNLLKICLDIQKNKGTYDLFVLNEPHMIQDQLQKKFTLINSAISQHAKNFGWMAFNYEGPAWKEDYFIALISSLLRQKINFAKALAEEQSKNQKVEAQRQKLIKKLNLSQFYQDLLEVARGMIFTKGARKDSMFYGYYCQDFINREIARRKYLSVDQVRYIYNWELLDILLKSKNISDELNQRIKHHLFLSDIKGEKLIVGHDKVKDFFEKINLKREEIDKDMKELLGDCASPGKVRGVVQLVDTPEQMKDFKADNIMVSINTSPDLMPAMKKAKAFITNVGGITSHAAIVSRELGKPCVIGTKIATKVLKNGDLVEVDASHGKVTIIKKA